MLQAFLHWAAAECRCPAAPVCDVGVERHLTAAVNAMAAATQRGWVPRWDVLQRGLHQFMCAVLQPRSDLVLNSLARFRVTAMLFGSYDSAAVGMAVAAVRHATGIQDVSAVMAGAAALAQEQLAEVAVAAAAGDVPPAAPLPSLKQLAYVCHHSIAQMGLALLQMAAAERAAAASPQAAREAAAAQLMPVPNTTGQQAQDLLAAALASSEALLQLAPDSPKSWMLAGAAAQWASRDTLSLERLLRGAELAQAQRADVQFASCASKAGALASHAAASMPASLAARAAAVAAQVEPATKRAARLLPSRWVQHDAAERGPQPLRDRSSAAAAAEAFTSARASFHAGGCAGCGRRAVGLRRCGRCRNVFYCRRVLALEGQVHVGRSCCRLACQLLPALQLQRHAPVDPPPLVSSAATSARRAQWRQHKTECQPAAT